MKRVVVKYGCGFGRHEDHFEVEDDASSEEIEEMARDVAMEKFDWGFEVKES